MRYFLFLFIVLFLSLAGCTFDTSGPKSILVTDENDLITDQNQTVMIHEPNKLYVVHGYACGERRLHKAVVLKPSIRLPLRDKYEASVVIHNGWRLKFQKEELEVVGFGAAIIDTELNGDMLSWRAAGIISDEDRDQVIEFCHYYTAIAWTKNMGDYTLLRDDANINSLFTGGLTCSSGKHTSLHASSRYLHNNSFQNFDKVNILPQGFGFMWADMDEDYFLQAAYQLTPNERFIYGKVKDSATPYKPLPNLITSGTSLHDSIDYIDKSYVSWESLGIFKNGDDPNTFYFGDNVVGVAGDHFSMIQPHYSITPKKQRSWGVGVLSAEQPKIIKETTRVVSLPYQFAVPVLTGWNIYLKEDEEQVRELGVWIESFKWTRKGMQSGDLEYTIAYTYDDDEKSTPTGEIGVSFFGVTGLFPDY